MNPSSKHFPGFDPAKQHRQGRKPPAWYSTAWPRLVSRVLCRTHSETRIKNRCDPENKTWFCSYDSYSGSHGKSQVLLAVLTPKGNRHIKVEPSTSLFLVFLWLLSIPFYSFVSFLISHLRWRKCWSRRATALATVDQYFTPDTPSAIAPRESPRRWPADRPLNSGKHRWHGAQCCDKNLGNIYVSIHTYKVRT